LIAWIEFPIYGHSLTGERVERRLAAVLRRPHRPRVPRYRAMV